MCLLLLLEDDPAMTPYPGYAEDLQVGKAAYTMPTSRADFEEVFPLLVQDLTNHATQYGLPETALVWFRNVRSVLFSALNTSHSLPHTCSSCPISPSKLRC